MWVQFHPKLSKVYCFVRFSRHERRHAYWFLFAYIISSIEVFSFFFSIYTCIVFHALIYLFSYLYFLVYTIILVLLFNNQNFKFIFHPPIYIYIFFFAFITIIITIIFVISIALLSLLLFKFLSFLKIIWSIDYQEYGI